MIHSFQMLGVIRKITITGGNNRNSEARAGEENAAPAEGAQERKGPSALLFVQYGPRREPTARAVEFVNAVNIRIPNYKFPMLQDKLKVGQVVEIHGRVQGVFKQGNDDDGHLTNELVAERVVPQDVTQAPFAQEGSK